MLSLVAYFSIILVYNTKVSFFCLHHYYLPRFVIPRILPFSIDCWVVKKGVCNLYIVKGWSGYGYVYGVLSDIGMLPHLVGASSLYDFTRHMTEVRCV